jgi:hypothetical protein
MKRHPILSARYTHVVALKFALINVKLLYLCLIFLENKTYQHLQHQISFVKSTVKYILLDHLFDIVDINRGTSSNLLANYEGNPISKQKTNHIFMLDPHTAIPIPSNDEKKNMR